MVYTPVGRGLRSRRPEATTSRSSPPPRRRHGLSAADVRSGRTVGIRHLDRLDRPSGAEISGKSLGTYMQDNIFSPLGMTSTSYSLTPDMAARRVTIAPARPRRQARLSLDRTAGAPVREFGGGGLYAPFGIICVRAHDPEQRQGQRRPGPQARDRRANVEERDGRHPRRMLKTTNPARSEDAEFFPGMPKSWGLTFMINEEQAPTGRPPAASPGRPLQHLLLDRPEQQGRRRVHGQILPFVDTKTLQAFYDFESGLLRPFRLRRDVRRRASTPGRDPGVDAADVAAAAEGHRDLCAPAGAGTCPCPP